jgi:hypothetical protein
LLLVPARLTYELYPLPYLLPHGLPEVLVELCQDRLEGLRKVPL